MRPYIKKIEIRNYKTHRNTRILFRDGINSIVGPNGVGKSNILEAIIFGLGERSPKNLRVSSFSEIVYNNRKDIDVSVSLVIIDEDGNEHKFRRIYDPEKGEHKYRYNGRRVSRTSYIMNLMKLGGKGFKYVYIQQGDILNRANATPQDIREIIDEALGIKQYEEKKKAASKKLEEADIKLRTLEGKYSEVQRFIREYLREMINYHTLENINYIENLLKSAEATKEKEEILRKLERIGSKKTKVNRNILKIDKKLDVINNRINDIKRKLEFIEREIDRLEREEYRSLFKKKDEEREVRDEIIRHLIEESSEIKRLSHLIEDKKREIDDIKKKVIESKKEIKVKLKISKEIQREKKELEKEIDRKRRKLLEIEKNIEEINKRWKEELDKMNETIEEKARIIAEDMVQKLTEEDLKREIEVTRRRIKRIEGIIGMLSRKNKEVEEELNNLKKTIKESKKELLKYRRDIKKLKREILDAERLMKKLDKLIEGIRRDKNIVRNYYIDSKRVYETAKALRIKGCLGVLGEMIRGPNEIISLLREVNPLLWFGIVVNNHKTAEEVLKISRELGKNISVIVLSDYKDKVLHDRSIIYILKYPKKMEPIIKELFGNILLLSDDDEILEAISTGFSAVHITGDYIIGRGVWFRAKKSRIHLPKNVEKINEIRDKFAKMIEKRKIDLSKKKEEYEKLQNKHLEKVSKARFLTQNKKLLTTQIKYFDEWKKDLIIKLKELTKREEGRKREKVKYEDITDKLRRELSRLESKRELLNNDISDMTTRLKDLSNNIFEINNIIANYRGINQDRKEKITRLKNEIASLKEERDRIRERIKNVAIQLKNINISLKHLDEIEEKLEKRITSLKEKRDKLKKKYTVGIELERKYSNKKRQYERLLLELEYKLKELQRKLDELNTIIEELGFGDTRLEKLEYIDDILSNLEREKLDIEEASKYSETRYYTHIESYKMYSIRRNELLKERESILRFIEEIDREKERVFLDGFNKIRKRFSSMFNEVFPGAKAYIELLDPEDIDSDVQIYVEFREKPKLPLSALSGGEKTAIIILFLLSVYSIKEDTVFLLDEVDAHLDVKNVENVAKVIRSQKKYSQIILVTLPGHDSMVTIADYVIPVVFKKGTSKVFQMEREHLERMIGK